MAKSKKKLSKIKFESGAFDKSGERNSLQGNERFTSDVYKWNELVEALDRHDSFAELLIDPRLYAEKAFDTPSGEQIRYGIPHQSFHEVEDQVVFEHQKSSAEAFLKKLRGFGLLADVVGSGKTFEAGIVLSELAVRGLVSTALFIVPGQVYDAWVRTMERFFGLGKWDGKNVPKSDKDPVTLQLVGARLNPNDFEHGADNFDRPKRPMIVKMEDFVNWDERVLANKLFDVVIVDEAHHLNVDKGEDAKAMILLSEIMKTKKAANMTYCLLLSATPHNGNLADMFRLWYFIRCKGGEPNDFREGVKRTAEFEEEFAFYLNSVCRGATTIMDFVRKEKIAVVRGGDAVYCQEFRDYFRQARPADIFDSLPSKEKNAVIDEFFNAQRRSRKLSDEDIANAKNYLLKYYNEVFNPATAGIRKKFDEYLKNNGVTNFDYFYEGLKEKYITDFLDINHETRDAVKKMVAESYHHGVLRSIMIRQPQDVVAKPPSRKHAVNIMYFRTRSAPKDFVDVAGLSDQSSLRIKLDTKKLDFMNLPDAVTPIKNGKPVKNAATGEDLKYPLSSYINYACKENEGYDYNSAYGRIIRNYLSAMGLSNADHACEPNNANYGFAFPRSNSLSFYDEQVGGCNFSDSNVKYSFEPLYDPNKSDLDFKLEKLYDILREHKNERIVVFFDYEVSDDKKISGAVFDKLMSSKEFSSRVIDTRIHTKQELEKIFGEKSDAILVAIESELTEGANFQAGNIIVNLQVTPNPLDMQQRIGRVFRLGQEHDITIYSIANMYDLEGYVLAYFTRIGLMSGNTGDAEILAGCNNDNMVSIRCPKVGCGNVELLLKEDFVNRGKITCSKCGEGTMSMISTRNVKCNDPSKRCRAIMTRSNKKGDDMYKCLAGGEGHICNNGNFGDRTYYCLKICAIAHCSLFTEGPMKGKCKALQMYKTSGARPDLAVACMTCEYKTECAKRGCILGEGPDAIKKCSTCPNATCKPKPHSITFNTNWEADCPICGRGKLAPVKNNSFESYIRGLFDYIRDGGRTFCDAFQNEINKVIEIQDILRTDSLKEED